MSIFTGVLGLFTIILYTYFILLRRELIFVSKRRSKVMILLPVFAALFLFLSSLSVTNWDGWLQGLFSSLIVLTYLFHHRGLAENRLVLHSLDNKGIRYEEIDRVVILHDAKKQEIKINFFRRGLRLPLFQLNHSLEELLPFLTKRLKKGTTIDIIFD
ncbi:hypothetical protein ACYSNO_00845 [Enterococcus sp. LJL98]